MLPKNVDYATQDLINGFKKMPLSWHLAWRESFLPYKLGFLGPIWITLQTGLWVLAVGLFIGPSLASAVPHYFAYVAIGFSVYNLFTVLFVEGSNVFIRSTSFILNIPNPYTIYVLKVIFRGIIQFIMAIPVIILAMAATGLGLEPVALLAIPGVMFSTVFGLGVALAFGSISVIFRDMTFGLQAVMRLMMFVTPIFWVATDTGFRSIISQFNPIFHFLELVRRPLLGEVAATQHWVIALLMTVISLIVGFGLFLNMRSKLAVWL